MRFPRPFVLPGGGQDVQDEQGAQHEHHPRDGLQETVDAQTMDPEKDTAGRTADSMGLQTTGSYPSTGCRNKMSGPLQIPVYRTACKRQGILN